MFLIHTYVQRKQAAYMDTLISKYDGSCYKKISPKIILLLVKMRLNQHTSAMVRQSISQRRLGSRKMKMKVLSLCQMI